MSLELVVRRQELERLEARERADAHLEWVARGVASVERALRDREKSGRSIWPVPVDVGVSLGWPLCAFCQRPIEPGWQIAFRDGRLHPQCVGASIEQAAA